MAAILLACCLFGAAACDASVPSEVTPPRYVEPSPLSTGIYKPILPRGSPREILGRLGFEPATGDDINGIRLFESLEEYSRYRNACGDDDFSQFREYDGLELTWLPPGILVDGPQSAAVCRDGSISWFGQELVTTTATGLEIGYSAGKRAVWSQDSGSDRFKGEVAGRPSVVVTRHGFGDTVVAISTPRGAIGIHAHNMPLEDVLGIAEGTRCDEC